MSQSYSYKNNQGIDFNTLKEYEIEQNNSIIILPDNQKLLCNLYDVDFDDSWEILEENFQDKNYESLLLCQFMKFLSSNQDQKVKIITTLGEKGSGKSFILNILVKEYEENNYYSMIFPFEQLSKTQIRGINFYCVNKICQKNELTIFFDCDMFSLLSNNHAKSLEKLICLITRMSTCVFYVHEDARNLESFEQIIRIINTDKIKQKKQQFDNIIEVVNKWDGVLSQSLQDNQKYSKIIKKVFRLRKLNFLSMNDHEKENFACIIARDQCYSEFIDQMNLITQLCQTSQYESSFSNWKAFEQEQTCYCLNKIILCCFQFINENIEENVTPTINCYPELTLWLIRGNNQWWVLHSLIDISLGLFIDIINQQLSFKQDMIQKKTNYFKQIYLENESKIKQVLEYMKDTHISQTILCFSSISYIISNIQNIIIWFEQQSCKQIQNFQNNLNQLMAQHYQSVPEQFYQSIIQKCMNLESIIPEDFRCTQQIQQLKSYLQKDASLIIKLSSKSTFQNISRIYSQFIMEQFIDIFVWPQQMKQKKQLINQMFQFIKNGQFSKNKIPQNIQLLKKILQNQFQSAQYFQIDNNTEEQNAITFAIFFNLINPSITCTNNSLSNFEIHQQVLLSCFYIFRVDDRIRSLDLQQIYYKPPITIRDQDFEFCEQLIFINKELNSYCQSQFFSINSNQKQLYTMLFFLKNRDEDLFLTFIYYAYFYEYLYSLEFAQKMSNEDFIKTLIIIQQSLI